ncbi:MAG: nuclear transport factor 2 family protein [Bdellovibrionota bacterium]|nr:nuclear transport factor 2 family protein [Bdellovibrionota bacterium]
MRSVLFVFFLGLSACSSGQKLEKNKEVVKNFYLTAFNEQQPRKAVELYVGEHYKQHNPYAPDGKEAFINFFEAYFKKMPKAKIEIKRVLDEKDLVLVHVHSKAKPDDRGRAVMDLFRVTNGKVVEHWDVVQPIPEKSANSNTMF